MRLDLPPNSALTQWRFEIFCAVVAVWMLVAMCIVLYMFDSESAFDGPVVTLNAIISMLSTASRVSLVAMLASAISQWNWLLFSESNRRLLDFQHLAEASRGPLGSVKVLLDSHIVGGWTVRAGALVTVLTIALDPFAQQLVQIKEELRSFEQDDSLRASIQTASGYSRGMNAASMDGVTVEGDKLFGNTQAHIIPDYAMELSVLTAFAGPGSGISQQPGFNCTSGSCEFEPYESLSVCSRCDDITSSLKKRAKEGPLLIFQVDEDPDAAQSKKLFNTTEYYLPNGLYLNNADDDGDPDIWVADKMLMTMFGTGDRNKTVAMQAIDTLLWDQSFIMVDHTVGDLRYGPWPGPRVSAYECELHYCIKEFTAVIKDGELSETYREVDEYKRDPNSWRLNYPAFSQMADPPDLPEWTQDYLPYDPILSAFPRTPLELGLPPTYQSGFAIDSTSVWSNNILMKKHLTACIDRSDNCTEENQGASFGPPNGYFHGGISGHKPDFAKTLRKIEDLDSMFRKISESMTTAMRNDADPVWLSTNNYTNDPNAHLGPKAALGKVIQPVPVYLIVWPWITLHFLSTLGGLVFLTLTIRFSAKACVPAWKTSELAIFAQACGMERIFDGDEKRSELEQKARAASVMFPRGKTNKDSETPADKRSMLTQEAQSVESQE